MSKDKRHSPDKEPRSRPPSKKARIKQALYQQEREQLPLPMPEVWPLKPMG